MGGRVVHRGPLSTCTTHHIVQFNAVLEAEVLKLVIRCAHGCGGHCKRRRQWLWPRRMQACTCSCMHASVCCAKTSI